jgi:hypothetical protein
MEYGNKSKNKRCKANGWLPELYLVGSVHHKKKTKKRLGRCLMGSVMVYGSELWVENKSQKTNYRQSKWTTYDIVQEDQNWKEFPLRKSGECEQKKQFWIEQRLENEDGSGM